MKKKLLAFMILSIVTSGMFIGCGSNSSKTDTATPAKTTEATKEPAKTAEPAKQTAKATETTGTNNDGIVQVPVTIENGTDVDFSELYTSGIKVENWGDNLISNGEKFSPGKAIKATFNVDTNNLKWDFKAVDGNGDSLEFNGLDLSNCNADGVKIKLTYDRNTQTGTITAE